MEDEALKLARKFSGGDIIQKVEGGEIGCFLYKIKYDGNAAVIKIGFKGQPSWNEVESNLTAYEEIKLQGLSEFISPKIFAAGKQSDNITYFVMEYLGKDFRNSAKTGETCGMTNTLIESLKKVYKTSKKRDPEKARTWLNGKKSDLVRYYEKYLMTAHYLGEEDISLAKSVQLENISPANVTFATSDLTPDNVFIKEGRAMIIDPKPGMLGIPLIDLAMFSTLVGEVYNLPDGNESAKLIRNFAFSKDLEDILECDSKVIKKLFELGEARQYSLSSRFRIGKDPRAELFAKKSVEKLKDVLR